MQQYTTRIGKKLRQILLKACCGRSDRHSGGKSPIAIARRQYCGAGLLQQIRQTDIIGIENASKMGE
jgi:hypothetical protein